MFLAVDCIDELAEAIHHARSGFNCLAWNLRSKEVHKAVMIRLCIALYMKYSKNEPGCVLYEFRRMKNKHFDSSAELSEETAKYIDVVNLYVDARDAQERERLWKLRIENENAQVEALKEKMACNLQTAKKNLKNAENLEKMSEECLKEANNLSKASQSLVTTTPTRSNYLHCLCRCRGWDHCTYGGGTIGTSCNSHCQCSCSTRY